MSSRDPTLPVLAQDDVDGHIAYEFSTGEFAAFPSTSFQEAPAMGDTTTLLGAAKYIPAAVAKQEPSFPDSKCSPKKQGRVRKAPDAPKRFRSSYICFFVAKQSEIKAELGQDASVASISKRSAEMWKGLSKTERAHWDGEAEKDKLRYNVEKASYSGPWKVPWKRAKKNPNAPKRPMSAFLLFSQKMRSQFKAQHPEMTNNDVSRLLGEKWRSMSEEEKSTYRERELKSRAKYKIEMDAWRKEQEAKEAAQQMVHADQTTEATAEFLSDPSSQGSLISFSSLAQLGIGNQQALPPHQQWAESLLGVPTGMPILLGPSGIPLPPRLQQVPAAPPQVFDEPLGFPTDEEVTNEAGDGEKS